jgi:AmmeMemoRadiSam system protein B/AmmeMemoRadiSam system protein A
MPSRLALVLALALVLLATATLAAAAERVRSAVLAGTWYQGDPADLAAYLDRTLDEAPAWAVPAGEGVRALIVPHAGYRYSGATAAAGYRTLRGRAFDRVVLLGPSHHAAFRGVAIADAEAWATPLGEVPIDLDAVARLRATPLVGPGPAGPDREHSLEIQLPFLQRTLAPGWRLVPVMVGRLDREDYAALADAIRPLLGDRTLVVVSTDFTHYGARFGFEPFAADDQVAARLEALDGGALAHVAARDPAGFLDYQQRTGITICGFRAVALLLHLLPPDARAHRLHYATSGGLLGDYGSSVSYLSVALTRPEPAPAAWQPDSLRWLHRLAALRVLDAVAPSQASRAALDAHSAEPPRQVREPAGAFVTLRKAGKLRGCIGYVAPVKPVWEAVLDNAEAAALRDGRFAPVGPGELADLDVEVSVLTEPVAIPDWTGFEVGRHGIVLVKGARRAVFLPDVAVEQGWDREQTLAHLARKAGLPADGWREGAQYSVFTNHKVGGPLPGVVGDQTPAGQGTRATGAAN